MNGSELTKKVLNIASASLTQDSLPDRRFLKCCQSLALLSSGKPPSLTQGDLAISLCNWFISLNVTAVLLPMDALLII